MENYLEIIKEVNLTEQLSVEMNSLIRSKIIDFIYEGDLESIKKIESLGFDLINIDLSDGSSPFIFHAYRAMQPDIANYLLESGEDLMVLYKDIYCYRSVLDFPYLKYYYSVKNDSNFYERLEKMFLMLKNRGIDIYTIAVQGRDLLTTGVDYCALEIIKVAVNLGFAKMPLQQSTNTRCPKILYSCIRECEKDNKYVEIFKYLVGNVVNFDNTMIDNFLSDIQTYYETKGNDNIYQRKDKTYTNRELLTAFNDLGYRVECSICGAGVKASLDKPYICSKCAKEKALVLMKRMEKNEKARFDRRSTKHLAAIRRYNNIVYHLEKYFEQTVHIKNCKISSITYGYSAYFVKYYNEHVEKEQRFDVDVFLQITSGDY